MSSKEVGNADWIAREEGRIPTKGAKAAQRASAGLGATDHDAELLEEQLVLGRVRPRQPSQRPVPHQHRA
jgi:hypothetical protein